MEEKRNYEETLKLFEHKYSLLAFKRLLFGSEIYFISIKSSVLSAPEMFFNKFYPFSGAILVLNIEDLIQNTFFIQAVLYPKMISWLQVYLPLIYGSDFQQLSYVDLHMLAGRVIASNKLRPKLIAQISLGSCRENPSLVYLHVCTSCGSESRENNTVIFYSFNILIQMLQLFLLLLPADFRDTILLPEAEPGSSGTSKVTSAAYNTDRPSQNAYDLNKTVTKQTVRNIIKELA